MLMLVIIDTEKLYKLVCWLDYLLLLVEFCKGGEEYSPVSVDYL